MITQINPYIELIKPSLTDGPRLTVLKCRYNRLAGRLNRSLHLPAGERDELFVALTYLKQQISTY
jgi:hypothetical protein